MGKSTLVNDNYFKTRKHTQKTLEDWRALPESEKADLIDHQIYLQAAPKKQHSIIQLNLAGLLFPQNANKGPNGYELNKWVFATEVGVVYNEDACTHDLAGWKTQRINEYISNPGNNSNYQEESYFEIIPDWVCEITSTNWKMDTIIKRDLLEKFKVPHYWIISPVDKSITVLGLDANFRYVTVKNGHYPPFENLIQDVQKIFNY